MMSDEPATGAGPSGYRMSRRMIIVAAVVLALFVAAMEIAAARHDFSGPTAHLFGDLLFGPKRGRVLWAALLLTLVSLTNRERLTLAGVAVVIDAAFFLGRLPGGTRLTFGNGPFWAMLGLAVWAGWTWEGARRRNALQGIGLALAIVFGTKLSDTWLRISAVTRPEVLDEYVQTADHVFGNPAWWLTRVLDQSGFAVRRIIETVYIELPVAALLLTIYQLRDRIFRFIKTFLAIAMTGPICYLLFPVVGPKYFYGEEGNGFQVADVWPHTLPLDLTPHAVLFDGVTPRNCMPSLHTAWSVAIFVHTRRGPAWLRFLGTFWMVGTIIATMGLGYHYGVDVVAGVVFSLLVESVLRDPGRGWFPARWALVLGGAAIEAAMLASYRFLSVPMAEHQAVSAVLLLAATGAMVGGFYATFFGRRNPSDATDGDRRPAPPIAAATAS